MKKSLALVLVLAMAFALAIPAFATEAPVAKVTPVTDVSEDGRITISLEVPENTSPSAATFMISYDKEHVKFYNAEPGDLLMPGGAGASNEVEDGVYKIALSTSSMGSNDAGSFAKVMFDLVDKAWTGTLTFKIEWESIYMADASTKFEIECPETVEVKVGEPDKTEVPPTTEPAKTDEPDDSKEPDESKKPDESVNPSATVNPSETVQPSGTPGTNPPPTGGMTMIAVAAVSAIAGLGALGLRKKEN